MNKIGLSVVTLLGVAYCSVITADELNSSKTQCFKEQSNELRIVQLVYESESKPLPCKVLYTKAGQTSEEGSAKNTQGHCERIERNIVKNLVQAEYKCQHRFTGSLNTRNEQVVLDLFSAELEAGSQQSMAPADTKSDVLPLATIAAPSSPSSSTDPLSVAFIQEDTPESDSNLSPAAESPAGKNRLEQLEVKLEAILRKEFLDVLKAYVESETSQAGTLSIQLDVDVQVTEKIQAHTTTAQQGVDNQQADNNSGVPIKQSTIDQISTGLVGNGNETRAASESRKDSSLFAVLSNPFGNEEDAHRFAAEFHRIYPNVASRVVSTVSEDKADENEIHWYVSLGTDTERAPLERGVGLIDDEIRTKFEVLSVAELSTEPQEIIPVSNDWLRYLIAACYADGKTDSRSMRSCSGYLIDEEDFINCLGGGACVAELRPAEEIAEYVDYLTVLDSGDPVVAARQLLMDKVEHCESADAASSREFTTCAARAMMSDNQREMLDCYDREQGDIGLLKCSGSESLAENVALYERCAVDGYFASECVLENLDNDYLSSASRCVHYGETKEVLSCALDANLDVDESRVLSCLQYSDNSSQRASCLAENYLDEDQMAIVRCSETTDSVADLGLCSARYNGSLSADELLAAECLLSGSRQADSFLDCAGGRLAVAELGRCVENGVPSTDCMVDEIVVAGVATGTLEHFLDDELVSSDIAQMREAMYADKGGDLPEILSSSALTKLFSSTVEVTKKAAKKTTKATKRLWNKLGFGNK